MSTAPLFPDVFDAVAAWLASLGAATPVQQSAARRQQYPRVWELNDRQFAFGKLAPQLLLPQDFPLSPPRIQLDSKLCLVLPHVESDGNFCHGIVSQPEDLENPIVAAGRVLEALDHFVEQAANPGWVEAEFHRERQDYWRRYVDAAVMPADYKTDELFVDIPVLSTEPQIVNAITFGNGRRALATATQSGPEEAVKSRGWTVGTIVRGSALAAHLPSRERWTPRTWPTSFAQLSELVEQINGRSNIVRDWYSPAKWAKKAPIFVVLFQDTAAFGWRLIPCGLQTKSDPTLIPIKITRIDRQWCLSRDYHAEQLSALTSKSVVVFGCGSLGSPAIELLARAGVGQIDVVDPDVMKAENVARHSLGVDAIGSTKARELCARINRAVPGAKLNAFAVSAQEWLATRESKKAPDLVLDCTGDQAVRISMSLARRERLQCGPVMMAWMEPYCAAAHVVSVSSEDVWPTSDPAESAINVAIWPEDLEVKLPGCGQGFHPYGMADVWRVAGLVAERVIAVLNGTSTESEVHSMIRSREFFESVTPGITFNRKLIDLPEVESIVQRRTLREALHGN